MSDPIVFESATPRFALPLLFAGQAQREFYVNEALARTDLLLHCAIEGETSVPPEAPTPGQTWLVGSAPNGAFAAHAGSLACWTGGGWRFAAPRDGLRVFDQQMAAFLLFHGGWRRCVKPATPSGGATIDSELRLAFDSLIEKLLEAGVFATS